MTNKKQKDLCKAFEGLIQASEVCLFLEDLCTPAEIEAMVERLEIAKQLNQKKTYREIAENLKVSTTTVSRVARAFHHGKGGYDAVMGYLH